MTDEESGPDLIVLSLLVANARQIQYSSRSAHALDTDGTMEHRKIVHRRDCRKVVVKFDRKAISNHHCARNSNNI